MLTLAPRRPNLLRRLAAVALALTIISLAASDASAQYGRHHGGWGYGPGYYGRGYGGFYGPRYYNRGYYGGFYGGPGFYGRGYGGLYGYPYAAPLIAPPVYVAPPIYSGFGFGGGLFF